MRYIIYKIRRIRMTAGVVIITIKIMAAGTNISDPYPKWRQGLGPFGGFGPHTSGTSGPHIP